MFLFHQTWISLVRQRARTVLLLLLFLLVFAGDLGSRIVLSSAELSKERVLEQIGATVTLDYADEESEAPIFTEEIAAEMETTEYVTGTNQHYSDYATPVNFQNCKSYTGEDPSQQTVSEGWAEEGQEDWVVIDGNTNVAFAEAFRTKVAALSEGAYPTREQPGAVISRQLAEQEGLSVGDELVCTAYGREVTIAVTGIFQTSAVCEVTEDNIIGTAIFSFSPYNRIYTDLQTAANLFGIDPECLYIDVYVDSPSHVQTVGKTIKSYDLDWSVFRLVNTTQSTYETEAQSIEAAISATDLITTVLSVFSVLMIILVTSFWAGRSWYEGGIFLALGTSKWVVLLQQFLAAALVAVPALLLAVLLSQPMAGLLLKGIAQLSTSGGGTGVVSLLNTGTDLDLSITLALPEPKVYLAFAGRCVLAIVCACLLPGYSVLRLKPREILSRE